MFQDLDLDEKYEFKWEEHYTFLKKQLSELVTLKEFSDVTLVCDDQIEIKAHRNLLSGASPVFKNILHMNSCRDKPVIYLRGIKSQEMKNIINFIYLGQVIIPQSSMKDFLAVANDLEIEHLNNVLRNTKITEHGDRDEKSLSEDVMNSAQRVFNEIDPLTSGDVKLEYLDNSSDAVVSQSTASLAIPDNIEPPKKNSGNPKRKEKKFSCDHRVRGGKCNFKAIRKEELQQHKDTVHDNVQVSWGVGLVWSNLNKNANK